MCDRHPWHRLQRRDQALKIDCSFQKRYQAVREHCHKYPSPVYLILLEQALQMYGWQSMSIVQAPHIIY